MDKLNRSGRQGRPDKASPRSRKRARIGLEALEDRLAPALIQWTNRDDFVTQFGPQMAQARGVIDEAIHHWEQVIDSFNYRNVGQSGWAAQGHYTLTVGVRDWQAVAGNPSTLARGSETAIDGDGKPWSGQLVLDDNAANGTWYFDPTPLDSFEFTNSVAPFAADGGPAGTDLYSVVLHEVGHALGFNNTAALAIRNRITNHIFSFRDVGGAIMTPDDSHLDDFFHANDLMTPAISPGMRKTVSDLDLRILRDAYGYSVRMDVAQQLSFISTFDPATGRLTVWGDRGTTFNDIRLDVFPGGDIFTIVNGRVKRISQRAVRSIEVRGGAGRDEIRVGGVAAGQPVTVLGGAGENFVFLSYNAKNLNTIQGNVSLWEEGGRTHLNLHDESNGDPRTITINQGDVRFSGSNGGIL